MAIKLVGLQTPCSSKAAVPQLEVTIRCEHGKRLKQAVERRSACAEQCVSRGRKRELFGSILGNQNQSAIGHRLSDHAQMGSVGKRPSLFLRFTRSKPSSVFGAPLRKIANFRCFAIFTRIDQQAFKIEILRDRAGIERKYSPKRLIGKGQNLIGVELCHTDRQLIEH